SAAARNHAIGRNLGAHCRAYPARSATTLDVVGSVATSTCSRKSVGNEARALVKGEKMATRPICQDCGHPIKGEAVSAGPNSGRIRNTEPGKLAFLQFRHAHPAECHKPR